MPTDAKTATFGALGFVLFAISACTACNNEWTGWDDVPTATITPRASTAHDAEWTAFVTDQAAVWANILAPFGCAPPFVVGDGGHVVELVPASDWSYGDGVGGMTTDVIEVREAKTGGVRRSSMLLHELGHALGLDHADAAFGASIMTAKVGTAIAARDVAAAACRLGCGPCDPQADPYAIGP